MPAEDSIRLDSTRVQANVLSFEIPNPRQFGVRFQLEFRCIGAGSESWTIIVQMHSLRSRCSGRKRRSEPMTAVTKSELIVKKK